MHVNQSRSEVSGSVQCVEVAAATLFTYDYFTTLAAEVDLVWRGRWGVGKILFLMSRYVMWPEVVLVFYYALFKDAPTHCRFTFTYSMCSVLAALTIADAILVLGTWAIWQTSRRVLIFLSAFLCALTVTNAYYFARDMQEFILISPDQVDPSIAKMLGRHSCTVTAIGRDIGVPWIAVAAFELVIFLMTVFKLRGGASTAVKCRSSRLSSAIHRDGTLYFTLLFGVSSANAVLVYTQPPDGRLLSPGPLDAPNITCAGRDTVHRGSYFNSSVRPTLRSGSASQQMRSKGIASV